MRKKQYSFEKHAFLILASRNILQRSNYHATFCGLKLSPEFYSNKTYSYKQLLRGPRIKYWSPKIHKSRRDQLLSADKHLPEFTVIAQKQVLKYLPLCYLEGYSIMKFTSRVIFPFNSSLIVDSTSYNTDELFKFWVANQRRKGSKYWIYQHGGGYNSMLVYSGEITERRVSDRILSWGKANNSKHQISLGVDLAERDGQQKKIFLRKYLSPLLGIRVMLIQRIVRLEDHMKSSHI